MSCDGLVPFENPKKLRLLFFINVPICVEPVIGSTIKRARNCEGCIGREVLDGVGVKLAETVMVGVGVGVTGVGVFDDVIVGV